MLCVLLGVWSWEQQYSPCQNIHVDRMEMGEGRATPWPACLAQHCFVLLPPEVHSGRKDEAPPSQVSDLSLPPARWSCNITCANVSCPRLVEKPGSFCGSLMAGEELLSSPPGQLPCRGVGCSLLQPSLAGQLQEGGLGAAVDALRGDLLLLLGDVCCIIPQGLQGPGWGCSGVCAWVDGIIFEKMQRCCLMLQIGFMFRAGLFYTPGDLHCVLPGMSVWKDQGQCFMLRMWSSLCCVQSWA